MEEGKPIEGNEKIDLQFLIADDEGGMRKLLERMLLTRYSSVESVENGRLLVEKLLSPGANFNFIITDNDMPEMNGLEAIKKIRVAGNTIPIIMLTTYHGKDYESFKKEVKALGVTLLEKPVKANELYATIEKIRLERARPQQ